MPRQQRGRRQQPARPARGLAAPVCAQGGGDDVLVRFSVQREVKFGEAVRLVGSHPSLGNWKVGGRAGGSTRPAAVLLLLLLRPRGRNALLAMPPLFLRVPPMHGLVPNPIAPQVRKAPSMGWREGHIWVAEVALPPGTALEFKVRPGPPPAAPLCRGHTCHLPPASPLLSHASRCCRPPCSAPPAALSPRWRLAPWRARLHPAPACLPAALSHPWRSACA